MTDQPQVWNRIEGEGLKAYAAFCAYRDMPPGERSMKACHARIGQGHPKTIEKYHRLFDWPRRALAFDDWKSFEVAEKEIDARVEARTRWCKQARLMQDVAFEALVRRAKTLRELWSIPESELTDDQIKARWNQDLSMRSIQQLLVHGMDSERLSIGEPTEITRTDSFDQWMADLRKSRGLPAGESPFGTVN